MDIDRFASITRAWTRSIDRRPLLQALVGLVLGLLAGHRDPPEQIDARKRQKRKKHQKRRKPEGEASVCRQRCHQKSGKARRRCRRRCQQGDESVRPCNSDRDCAPCARCRPEGCVATCQAGEVCQDDRCTTPGPDICPTADTEMVVTSYAEVAADYAKGSDLALPYGPDAVANFVHERFTDLYDQFSSEVQEVISPEFLAGFSFVLQHNRVHFEVPSSIGTFDGYFEGEIIEGYFTQIFTLAFWITRTTPPTPEAESPLEGRWEGIIYDPTGAIYQTPFDIVVTFTRISGELTGILDVLGVIENIPITNISVSESRPLSTAPSGDVRVIPQPHWTQYSTLIGWGEFDIAFSFFIDDQGEVIGIDIVPDWPVPPDPAGGLPIETVLRFPFNGVWWINAGGPRQYENHHATDPASRHALDLVPWNKSGIYQPNADENAEFWAWEQPVFAPAAGKVIDMANDVPDNILGFLDPNSPGNMIVLQTAPQEFLLMGHLRQGSVAVAIGEQVEEGQFLARIGNSGYSFGPHMHMQLQDRYDVPFHPDTVSLPFRFKGLLVNGQPKANPSLVWGDFVQHSGCPIPVPTEHALQPDRDRPSRPARGSNERPMVTQRSAEWLRSPAAAPLDSPSAMPWGKR